MYFIIHTMTITQCDYVLQAQFVHALPQVTGRQQVIARRMRLRLHPHLAGAHRAKTHWQRVHTQCPSLKTLMKTNSANVRHHLRTIQINPQAAQFPNASANGNLDEKNMVSLSPVSSHHSDKQDAETTYLSESLQPTSNPQQTVHWLSSNRFEKLVQTFANFSGADMLRMSRDDLIQICGHADGIRLHNALHSKSIAPKLTLYVCKEDSNVFNAVYLLRLSYTEIIQKLATFLNMSAENIRDVYVQGPHMIHVQLNTEVMKHIKNETMFNVEVIDQNTGNISQQQQQITNGLVVLLKPVNRTNS